MTLDERNAIIRMIGQIISDNNGNRITHALCIGILTDLEANLPKPEPAKPAPDPAP